MVDVRPLLFANALAFMLLVTAGFASVREDTEQTITDQVPSMEATVAAVTEEARIAQWDSTVFAEAPVFAEPALEQTATVNQAPDSGSDAADESTRDTSSALSAPAPFELLPMQEEPSLLAYAEPVMAMNSGTDIAPAPETRKEPEPEPPATGKLILRSNVVGDDVTINGKHYGQTRLDLEMKPGRYAITISKPGYQDWSQTVRLEAGKEMTLIGRLKAFTNVDFRKGTWVGGVKTGDGTYQGKDGLRYEGHFINGKFHGEGTAWYPDGTRYDGQWNNGLRHGDGTWRSADGSIYSGEFAADQFNGKGTLTMASGDILTGHWQDGRLNGQGSLTTAEGMLYVGGFRSDEFHGQGALTYPDGRHYEGQFSNGTFHGTGTEVFADGKKYEGQYIDGKFHGKGLLLNPNGSSIEATFRHGEPYGQVRLTTAAGEIFTARTSEPGVCYRDKSYRATQCPKLEGW
ncbi:PEGA domain-containing protein [Marinobacter salinisoli]|uniref:PEGA domain-containing protein n=1 Tax=Marinobacter salinisoli TaxID=2769486 RepID=A0ABX7MPZ8_9GAMM|nr:PEGA domain-containing protein [Marinobacter salinisoli]QSP93470.1 PEGA domain-containing protein [Marinobacter salinisoli]